MTQAIAIVGMAGRFPGAKNLEAFWRNLVDGVETIRDRTDEELLAAGVRREELANPDYVRRSSILADVPMFDAGFFGLSPRDAAIMDPQHRHFLEVAWEALETAGHVPSGFNGSIGVFAGSGMNTYLIHNLLGNRKLLESAGLFQLKQTGNDKDVLATRVSYQLDLRGPAINVQTACSTSLVAIHLACQSLLNFECDMALAGGVTIEIPHAQGYVYREGEILARDGHCRAFDRDSTGTVFASGLGIVALRRLEDALEDHDAIRAVILGSAINNDGARKVGYLAPSVDGQMEVISEALDYAGVSADEISYVETHGTGTRVGDPIEVRALTQAFRRTTTRRGFCGLGSLKPSVGHLDAAAGVASVIKTTLALEHAVLPESLNFDSINPHIDLASSPFYINNRRRPWTVESGKRRAGVTSLGIGGTNVHLILEEPPREATARDAQPWRLLVVSAKSAAAADRALQHLVQHLEAHPEIALADAAFTCLQGREHFAHRRALAVAEGAGRRASLNLAQAAGAEAKPEAARVGLWAEFDEGAPGSVGQELFTHEAAYRVAFLECSRAAQKLLDVNLAEQMYGADAPGLAGDDPRLLRVARFAVAYALAAWWRAHGVRAEAACSNQGGRRIAEALAGTMPLSAVLQQVAEEASEPSAKSRPGSQAKTVWLLLSTEALPAEEEGWVASLPAPGSSASEVATLLTALGKLWACGVPVDMARRIAPGTARRVPLPTYPFEHKRYWIESDRDAEAGVTSSGVPDAVEVNTYQRQWQRADLETAAAVAENWLVLHEGDRLAERLLEELRTTGGKIVSVEYGREYRAHNGLRFHVRTTEQADYAALLEALRQSGCMPQKILHLGAVGKTRASLAETEAHCFYGPLALAQAAMAQGLSPLEVAFVSRDLERVAEEPVERAERAVVCGVARVWPKEQPGVHCRTIDLSWAKGEEALAAKCLVAEMQVVGLDAAVAYRAGVRWQQKITRFAAAEAPRQNRLTDGGVYLITGGLGALGLIAAEALANKVRAHLVLVGRTAIPAEDQWESVLNDSRESTALVEKLQQLVRIRSLCSGLVCMQADAMDAYALRSVIEETERRFGRLDGVFHVAGVLDDAPMALKQPESAARVLAPKVRGTLALVEALGDRKLGCLVLYSSISAVDPPTGQVDYAAANAFLDHFAESRDDHTLAINWGAWREQGMAARTQSPHPWLDEKLLETPKTVVFSGEFSIARRWVLADHRFTGGAALIPGTGYLELAAGALLRGAVKTGVEFQNVYFLAPFLVEGSESRELRVELHADEHAAGAWRFSVFGAGPADVWTEHAAGQIRRLPPSAVEKRQRAEIAARCQQRVLKFDDKHRTRQERRLEFGPRWRTLKRLQIGKGEALAELELGEAWRGDLEGLCQHPALLDMATGAALYLTPGYEQADSLYLPISYQRMRVYRQLPAHFWSHIRMRSQMNQREVATFDIVLLDEQNEVLAEMEGFAMRRISGEAQLTAPVRLAGQSARPVEVSTRRGIAPAAGAEALLDLLAARTPAHVIAVHEPMQLAAGALTELQSGPEKPAAEAALQGGLEETLTAWWKELLGVERILPEDDFFALGGHSLVGVRLFARIKRSLGVDLELALLFEARTVRQLAALIESRQQPADSLVEPRVWKSLVAIQPKGSKPPIFCVHAVGGDVIFYEQLARALGPEQPFYAFQSPLVADPERRDLSIEKIAALYIEEMRTLSPQGPYLLGGASYGGFVLYEMARQLKAAGIEPGLVAMFDVVIPESTVILPRHDKYARLWQQLRADGLRYVCKKVSEKSVHFRDLFRDEFLHPAGVRLYKALGWELTPALRFNYVSAGHWDLLRHYRMEPFPGQITLIRASDRGPEVLGKREDPTLGWGRLAEGGLEVIDVPTMHMHMLFEPYVKTFAETLSTLLARGAAATPRETSRG